MQDRTISSHGVRFAVVETVALREGHHIYRSLENEIIYSVRVRRASGMSRFRASNCCHERALQVPTHPENYTRVPCSRKARLGRIG